MTGRWERLCLVEDVLPGRPLGLVVGDTGQDRDRVCVVAKPDGQFIAMLDRCPHRDVALSGGIVREGVLTCPGHFWCFDLESGRRTDEPSHSVTLYPTRVSQGWVEAQIPAPAARVSMREWLLSEADRAKDPEVGSSVAVGGMVTNYHDEGSGRPVLLVHGSGPGVSAWANWRLTIPALAQHFRVLAPDVLGFGYTERPSDAHYDLEAWTGHLMGFMDALELDRVSVVGNSFGGALALSIAARFPQRVDKLVLMGSVGVSFELTKGLDAVWGFEPSLENMRNLFEVFVHDRFLVDDELAQVRLRAATRPGVHEAFSAMFPAPRQAAADALTIPEPDISALQHQTLIVHGRDDRVIPLSNSLRLLELIDQAQLHIFGRCGHWVQIEHAERFNRLVVDFLT